jgi:hypothetical protein
MPQTDQPSIVSFQIPVKNDSQQVIGSRTVHVVVVKSTTSGEEGGFEVVAGPLSIVFVIAASIFVISSRIKPGSKADRLLARLEGLGKLINHKKQKGEL